MKIIFLGTNGWYDSSTGNTTCVLIECDKWYLILDAGGGFYKIGQYIKKDKPIYLFISHFHLDHIIGLHILDKFNFRQGLHIFSQYGTKKVFRFFINSPFTMALRRLKYKVSIHEIKEGKHILPFKFECRFLQHPSKCLGYRFNIGQETITFCTDTGYCRPLMELARGTDLFITECAYKIGERDKNWPHLNPSTAALAASNALAKKLVLLHFDAARYTNLEARRHAQKAAQKIFPNTIAAEDGMAMKL